jgi:hypothetical protein
VRRWRGVSSWFRVGEVPGQTEQLAAGKKALGSGPPARELDDLRQLSSFGSVEASLKKVPW